MPTTPGLQPTTSSPNGSDALCRLLATGSVRPDEWPAAFATAAASQDLALLTPWQDGPHGGEAERQAIRIALITNTARNQLFLAGLRRCLSLFTTSAIPCRVLKGAATIQDGYDDLGQRRLGDIDLLVPKERLAEAATLLMAEGFTPLLPDLARDALQDAHVLTAPAEAHHHWPPLVDGDGLVVELHWTLGDGYTALGMDERALWSASSPLPIGEALDWPYRVIHAGLTATAGPGPSPRAIADLANLLKQAPADGVARLQAILATCSGASPLVQLVEHLMAGKWSQPSSLHACRSDLEAASWRRRLYLLRSPAHVSLFLRLGWQAWRYGRWLADLPLPQVAERLSNRPQWRGRLTLDEVVAHVGFWQRQRWIHQPSYCLQRSALLFAGLTAIGERPALVFGLDPAQPSPVGHAWVERDGEPFLEDSRLIARMVPTYRHPTADERCQ